MKDNRHTMKAHPNRRLRYLIIPPEPRDGRTECTIRPIYVPRYPLREACLYLALAVALIVVVIDYDVLSATPFDRLGKDPYRTVAAQVDRAVERDAHAVDAYRKVGFLFRRSVDGAGTPHWKVSGYVPVSP